MDISNVSSDIYSNLLSDKYPDLYKHRFCDQEDFSIAICGGENDNGRIVYNRPFVLNNFETKVYLPSYLKPRYVNNLVSNSSNLYVAGYNEIKKYSYSSKIWNKLPELSYYDYYCICCFMQKLFVISYLANSNNSKFYDKESNKWCNITAMNKVRQNTACTVFEGKIIVSGGFYSRHRKHKLKSVEVYDHHEN